MPLTIVTVTVFNANGEAECSSERVDEHETVEEVIEACKENAKTAFDDYFYNPCGFLVNINCIEVPELPMLIKRHDNKFETMELAEA